MTLCSPGALHVPMFGGDILCKTEDGKRFFPSDFAYTPDISQPGTWKLRLTSTPGGKPDPQSVGAAVAALGKGFRGNNVSIPSGNLGTVKRRVLRAWYAANPGKGHAEIPEVLTHLDAAFEGIAPPGWEHTIQKMKNDSAIDNPFALAWFMKNRGIKPSTHAHEMSASADDTMRMLSLIRQQHQIPAVCIAAARGETWAQAQLLAYGCPPLVVEGRW